MPSHSLHKKWQIRILGYATNIDKIIDFPQEYLKVDERDVVDAIRSLYNRDPAVDPKVYVKWLKTHDQWRDFYKEFLYIILKKYGVKYFKGAVLHVLLDSFAPKVSKLGQADFLTFRKIVDYYKQELKKYFDKSLFEDVFKGVEANLNEILRDIAQEHKTIYKDVKLEDIVKIEIYYDTRTVNEENLKFIKQALEKLKDKYNIEIVEKQIDKMSKLDINDLIKRMNLICIFSKISMRISRKYTLGKELDYSPEYPFSYYIEKTDTIDSIILFVKYKDREIFYPHTPSKDTRFGYWIYPIDFVEYLIDKTK